MCNKACVLLKVNKKHLENDLTTNELIMMSDVLFDDHIDTNLDCLIGLIINTENIGVLPKQVIECINQEFPKLGTDEVIYIEIYKTENVEGVI